MIGTFTGSIDFSDYHNDYQKGLRDIIDAKIAEREVITPEVQEPPKVVNLMEALRRSLDSIGVATKTPARVESTVPDTSLSEGSEKSRTGSRSADVSSPSASRKKRTA